MSENATVYGRSRDAVEWDRMRHRNDARFADFIDRLGTPGAVRGANRGGRSSTLSAYAQRAARTIRERGAVRAAFAVRTP